MAQAKGSGIVELKKFFGFKPNQTLAQFKAKIDELTEDDKAELIELARIELGVK